MRVRGSGAMKSLYLVGENDCTINVTSSMATIDCECTKVHTLTELKEQIDSEKSSDIDVLIISATYLIEGHAWDLIQAVGDHYEASLGIVLNEDLEIEDRVLRLIEADFYISEGMQSNIVTAILTKEIQAKRALDEATLPSKSLILEKPTIDSITDMIWVKDLKGSYLMCNTKFEETRKPSCRK